MHRLYNLYIIPLSISIMLQCSKSCSTELPLRVRPIYTVCMLQVFNHVHSGCIWVSPLVEVVRSSKPDCGSTIKIHKQNNVQFLLGTATNVHVTIQYQPGTTYRMHKWLSKSPSTPPSSKAADVFWNSGSTSNSKSKVLMSNALGFRSVVWDVGTLDWRI